MANERIGYIDAMRGFVMILVVYAHICNFCFGSSSMGFDEIFFLFRMPCFFFISGWLFEFNAQSSFWKVTRRKFMVLIVPTFIFLLLLAPPPQFFSELGAVKGGYWFTFVLFEFFILYMLTSRMFGRWNFMAALVISIGAFIYSRYYHSLSSSGLLPLNVLRTMGFFSVVLWRHYLFFFIGTALCRHFETFLRFSNHYLTVFVFIIGFIFISSTHHTTNLLMEYLRFYGGGLLGVLMVFTLFRQFYSTRFRVLEYVGSRTLDIYLLHYFFLPRFLLPYGTELRSYGSPLLEFCVAMPVALMVLVVTLVASYVIRLSPFLEHFLFGVKYKNNCVYGNNQATSS